MTVLLSQDGLTTVEMSRQGGGDQLAISVASGLSGNVQIRVASLVGNGEGRGGLGGVGRACAY